MPNTNKTLTLQLTLEEVNKILSALGNQPYVEVYPLVQKLQQQARGQVQQVEEVPAVENEEEPPNA